VKDSRRGRERVYEPETRDGYAIAKALDETNRLLAAILAELRRDRV